MSELSQARVCPKCGEPMTPYTRPDRNKTEWRCKPCINARQREQHKTPERQAYRRAYREKHAEKIAAQKREWRKEDRAKDPKKYQEQNRRCHERLMADPERRRRKYDKASDKARLSLSNLKENAEAYEAYLQEQRNKWSRRYEKNKDQMLDGAKKKHYRLQYGITLEQLGALHKAQGVQCACCEVELPDPTKTKTRNGRGQWHLDHCHDTGEIRGLLCHRCNMGLGLFKDDCLRLQRAIRYLNGANADIVAAVLGDMSDAA